MNESAASNAKEPSSDAALQNAKLQLQKGELDRAKQSLESLLSERPDHRDGLYYLGVCERRLGNTDDALKVIDRVQELYPQYGRAYQEEGHSHFSRKDYDLAWLAYEKAVLLNPALLASWKPLVPYYQRQGNVGLQQRAQMQVEWLKRLPPQLLTVHSLIHEQKLYVAEQICRQFLKEQKNHPEAMRLLAEIGSELQILDDAELLLAKCVEFNPDFHRARLDYVKVLHKRQKFQAALAQAQELVRRAPGVPAYQVSLASELQAAGEFEQALAEYDAILADNNQIPHAHSARGHALKTVGRTAEAIDAYRAAYAAKADFGDAYWSLANLKTYRFSDRELSSMRELVGGALISDDDRAQLCFALGKAYEDAQDYAGSFDYYSQGNAIKQRQGQYRPERIEQEFAEHKDFCTQEFFDQREGWGCPDAAPIFIVGLPRAGSTLLEQILASHSQVDGTMELANIVGLAHRMQGRRVGDGPSQYPRVLGELEAAHFQRFGEEFIEDTQYHRQGGLFFIDKMPNNFRHLGMIKLMLPNAKVIDARRHPMSCCFSGFKQLFAEGQEFSYSLDSIGRYYRSYVELMQHWDDVLPGFVLRVQHEDVLDDLETQVRRMLDFCGLPFEQSCVDYHQTERAVRTPSSEQVRQPIFDSAREQWQNYAEHLSPLEQALGPALEAYRR